MNAVVLGGCADMAIPLLALLKNDPDIRRVVLADINHEKAFNIASDMGRKFESTYCNASENETIITAMNGNDIAFGYIGPFYLFEKRMVQCALETGVTYISISDDYDAYLDVIPLEEEAHRKNIKILTGFGNSPGITQILARKGYNDVPQTSRININWCAGSDESVGPSNLTHLFHIFNGTTLQTINGAEVSVKTGGGKKLVKFPEPIGQNQVYYTGHAESVSLPRNLPGLTEVTLHGGVKPNYIVVLIKFLSLMGLFKTHARRSALAKFFHKIEGWFASQSIDKSVGRIDIYGKENGRTLYKYFTYVGHIAEITSTPVYLAAKWLYQGKFEGYPGGIYTPERLFDHPEKFISALKEQGIAIYESDISIIE